MIYDLRVGVNSGDVPSDLDKTALRYISFVTADINLYDIT
jgi:hypothetical protein